MNKLLAKLAKLTNPHLSKVIGSSRPIAVDWKTQLPRPAHKIFTEHAADYIHKLQDEKNNAQSFDLRRPYRILCLDGGGVRGILTIALLNRICEAHPTFLDNVDFICGTSAGGILSLLLSAGYSSKECEDIYSYAAPHIFGHNPWRSINPFRAKYSDKSKQELMEHYFGNRTMADLTKTCAVVAFRLDGRKSRTHSFFNKEGWRPAVFSNMSRSAGFVEPDLDLKVWDAAMRTSAAPTFFPVFRGYTDGGIVANNPSIIAVSKAMAHNPNVTPRNVVVLSLDEDVPSKKNRENKKMKKLKRYQDMDIEKPARDGKREFMQKRNNLRTEKSKLAISLFNEISPDSPQFMKKSARPDSPLVSPVLSPSASASHLSIEVPDNRPGDEVRMVHSPYYRALFGNKSNNQDSSSNAHKNLLDEKQIGILLESVALSSSSSSMEESGSSCGSSSGEDDDKRPVRSPEVKSIQWPALSLSSPYHAPSPPKGKFSPRPRITPADNKSFGKSETFLRRGDLTSPRPKGRVTADKVELSEVEREKVITSVAIDRLYTHLFRPEEIDLGSERTMDYYVRRWDDPDSDSDSDGEGKQESREDIWTYILTKSPLDSAVVEVSQTLLKDSKMVAKYLKELQTMSSGRHRRRCNNDAPDRRLFAALVTDHFQPPQDNLTENPVMVASSLTLVNLLSLVRPSLFYALISALDFEDERFSSVRGALVRTLLGASHRAAVDCADDSGWVVFRSMSLTVLSALTETSSTRRDRCLLTTSLAERWELDSNLVATRGLPLLWMDKSTEDAVDKVSSISQDDGIAAPSVSKKVRNERPPYRAKDNCRNGLQLTTFLASTYLHHQRLSATSSRHVPSPPSLPFSSFASSLSGKEEQVRLTPKDSVAHTVTVMLALARIFVQLFISYGHKLGSASELMEQPDLLSDLLELLKVTLFLATCVDYPATLTKLDADRQTDLDSLEDQGGDRKASNVNSICEFIFLRMKSHLATAILRVYECTLTFYQPLHGSPPGVEGNGGGGVLSLKDKRCSHRIVMACILQMIGQVNSPHFKVCLQAISCLQSKSFLLKYLFPQSCSQSTLQRGSDLQFGLPPEDCDSLLDALVSALRENRNGRHWHPTVSANSSAALDTISMQVMASEDDDYEDDN
eukprot:gene27880-36734_t